MLPERSDRMHEWPEPPARMLVVFCSSCNAFLGIQDVDRMQHEHFEQSENCRHGVYNAAVYEQTMLGGYGQALREMSAASPRKDNG
jgi:hypothetical protein